MDTDRKARNRARNTASEDASGGYREIAGCKCENCVRLARTPEPQGKEALARLLVAALPYMPLDHPDILAARAALYAEAPPAHARINAAGQCSCGRPYTPEHAAATEAPGLPLDAAMLAQALRAVSPWKDDDAFLDVWANDARAIATEYARLRATASDRGET